LQVDVEIENMADEKRQELGTAAGVTVFRRSASGLTRQFGILDVLIYNVAWSMLLIPGAAYLYLEGPFVFPHGNILLALLIVGLVATPMFVAYAMLSSSMPRSGGDYVWQSRILHGSVGFITMMLMAFSLFIWVALNGTWVTSFSTSPMFTSLGIELHNTGLVNLGTFLATSNGVFIGTMIVNVLTFLMFLPGITLGLKMGRYGFIFVVIAMAALTIFMATVSNGSFQSTYNNFMNQLPGGSAVSYSAVYTAGVPTSPGTFWTDTLGMGVIAWVVLAWPMWVFLNLGEVKGAESLKRMTSLTVGSLWIAVVFMAIWGFEVVRMANFNWLAAAGQSYILNPSIWPIAPWYTNLVSMLSPIAAILVGLGVLATGFWECWVNYVGGSRIMLAASLDRVWPEWFGRIGRRYRQLVNVGITYLIMGIVVGALYDYNLFGFLSYTFYTSLVASLFQWFTMAAAIIFPYRAHMKDIWRTSPASRWVIGKIPIIVLGGIAGLVLQSIFLLYDLTVANLGINGQASLEGLAILLIGLGAYYFGSRAYWRSKGINIELAFRQVPPL
jgi:basic amino acid/polyamine antiporter, APA family